MEQRLSLLTLGVRDVAISRAFYERLGWTASGASQPGVTFFQLDGVVLALYGRDDLARDAGIPPAAPTAFSAVSLAFNLPSKDAVEQSYAEAVAAGATPLKPPHDTFWGGFCAYAADPDGYVWEYAYNPVFPLDPEGKLVLPA